MRMIRNVLFAASVTVGILAVAGPASAATFSVNPTQIFLAGRTNSSLVTVRNDSTEMLRFQQAYNASARIIQLGFRFTF